MPSSVVAAVRYDEKTLKLRVIFQSGAIYDYLDVPQQVYNEMMKAFAKGEFLNREIKPKYQFEKIR